MEDGTMEATTGRWQWPWLWQWRCFQMFPFHFIRVNALFGVAICCLILIIISRSLIPRSVLVIILFSRSYHCSCFPGFSGDDCGLGPLCHDGDDYFCENGGVCKWVRFVDPIFSFLLQPNQPNRNIFLLLLCRIVFGRTKWIIFHDYYCYYWRGNYSQWYSRMRNRMVSVCCALLLKRFRVRKRPRIHSWDSSVASRHRQ